jgi:hypothetical protein
MRIASSNAEHLFSSTNLIYKNLLDSIFLLQIYTAGLEYQALFQREICVIFAIASKDLDVNL